MRLVISGIAALTLSITSFSLATAETCGDRAQTCVVKWGNPKATCYEPFRLAACEKTGRYVAPNGNVWPAIRVNQSGRTDTISGSCQKVELVRAPGVCLPKVDDPDGRQRRPAGPVWA